MEKSPVAVYPPNGELSGPFRVILDDDRLRLYDKHDVLHHDEPVLWQQIARTKAFVDTPEGRWIIRDLCGCSAQLRAMKREWAA